MHWKQSPLAMHSYTLELMAQRGRALPAQRGSGTMGFLPSPLLGQTDNRHLLKSFPALFSAISDKFAHLCKKYASYKRSDPVSDCSIFFPTPPELPSLSGQTRWQFCVTSQQHRGPRAHPVIQDRRERSKQQGFLLFQIFTEGCNVLGFPLCGVRSSKRNFLEITKPLKALPGYPTQLGQHVVGCGRHQKVLKLNISHCQEDTQHCKHCTLI